EQEQVYDLWDLKLRYAEQTVAAQQAVVKPYYCPSRRAPPILSVQEGWYQLDPGPPPGPNSPSMELRFGAPNNPPGAVGDYASCVGDMRGKGNFTNGAVFNWFNVTSSGAIILGTALKANGTAPGTNEPAGVPIETWKSNTVLADVLDGTTNTFLGGEK